MVVIWLSQCTKHDTHVNFEFVDHYWAEESGSVIQFVEGDPRPARERVAEPPKVIDECLERAEQEGLHEVRPHDWQVGIWTYPNGWN